MNLMTLISSYVIKRKKKWLRVLQSLILVIVCKLVIVSFTLAAITVRMLARGLAIYYLPGRAGSFGLGVVFKILICFCGSFPDKGALFGGHFNKSYKSNTNQ